MVNDQPDVAFALRTGGDCKGGYVDPPVEFAEDNGERIRAALSAARPQGGADIVSQLRQGISDYNRFESVESAQVQSIWLFLASARDCRHGNSSLGKAIKKALAARSRSWLRRLLRASWQPTDDQEPEKQHRALGTSSQ